MLGGGGLGGFFHHGRGWSSAKVCRRPASSSSVLPSASGHLWFPGTGNSQLHPRLAAERLRPGVFQSHSTPFLKNVLGPEGRHRQETHYRSVSFKQDAETGEFQDGGSGKGGKISLSGPLGRQVRPQRCLPSHSPSIGNGSVLQLCARREDFRLSGAPFWSLPGPVAVHKGAQTCQEGSASFGDLDYIVPGRFPAGGSFSAGDPRASGGRCRASTAVGFQDKLEEIRPGPPETLGVPWRHPGPGEDDLFPSPGEGGKGSFPGEIFRGSLSEEVGVGVPGRIPELHSVLSPPGETLDEAAPCVGKLPLFPSGSSGTGGDGRGSQGSTSPLGGQGFSGVLRPYATRATIPSLDDRRISVGLGWCASSVSGLRCLGSGSEDPIYQLAGVEGHSPLSDPLPSSFEGAVRLLEGGQLDSSLLYQETRISSISGPLVSLPRDSSPGLAVGHSVDTSTPERGLECVSRQGFSRLPRLDGVVSRQGDLRVPLHVSWHPPGRPDGYLGESSSCQVRLSLPGHQGVRDGRLLLRLGPLGIDLPIPAVPVASGGGPASGAVQRPGVCGGSPLALGPLVLGPSREVSCQTSAQAGSLALPGDLQGGGFLPGGSPLQPSRLGAMRSVLRGDGFSEAATSLFLACHKQSTQAQYQSTWTRFLSFLESSGVPLHGVRLCHVHNFLAREAVELGKAYRTVASYKCALALPLQVCRNLDLSGPLTSKFMMGIWNHRPPKRRSMPAWDLSILLRYLRSDRFEDLRDVSFTFLTQKVLILLLIASGRRLSEIANLSRTTSVKESRTVVDWLPDFDAKWCSGFSGFVPDPPSFCRMDSLDVGHLRNCPVRALEIYLARRSSVVNLVDDDCFWTLTQPGLAAAFRSVVRASLAHAGAPVGVSIYPHQTKKLAVSYCWKYFALDKVQSELPAVTGNASVNVLKGSYLGSVPNITLPAVVPLGTIRP